jgi:hypothetical protein
MYDASMSTISPSIRGFHTVTRWSNIGGAVCPMSLTPTFQRPFGATFLTMRKTYTGRLSIPLTITLITRIEEADAHDIAWAVSAQGD